MAVIDLVKWSAPAELMAWKFPSEELSTWTQLIVNESQVAFLVAGGVYEGPFGAGRHVLKTENLPLLRALMGLPFGGQSPFSAEVWFINKASTLDIRWGTPDPIQLKDPEFGLMIPVRAFGQYAVRVSEPKKFLLKLVGTLGQFDTKAIAEYFRGAFLSKIKSCIANEIVRKKISVLEISPELNAISDELRSKLNPSVEEFGLELIQFNILSINVPEDDSAVLTLKSALARRAEIGILGTTYIQQRELDILQTAAGNEGTAGGLIGAGIGIGVGGAIGAQMGLQLGRANLSPQGNTPPSVVAGSAFSEAEKIQNLKALAELKSQGILTDEEFQLEKSRILRGGA